jgi:predicted transcriptional regulator
MNHTPNQTPGTRIATFKIGLDDYEQVEAVAERDDRSVSAVLRLAVRDYLDARLGKEKAA